MKRYRSFAVSWLIGLSLLCALWPVSLRANAEPEDCLLNPVMPGYRLVNAIPVTDEIMPRSGEEDAVFMEVSKTLTLTPGDRVVLTGSSNGQSRFMVDDVLQLQNHTGQQWVRNFRSFAYPSLPSPIEPQEITSLFRHTGENRLTIHLINRDTPEFSATPLWLVIFHPCSAMQASLAPLAATPTVPMTTPEAPKTVEDPHSGLHPALLAILLIGLALYWWLVTGHRGYWQTLLSQQKKTDMPPVEAKADLSGDTVTEVPAPKVKAEPATTSRTRQPVKQPAPPKAPRKRTPKAKEAVKP